MKLPKELTTVTPLSKGLVALTLFVLPVIGFFAGIQYQKQITPETIVSESTYEEIIPTITPTPSINMSNWKTQTIQQSKLSPNGTKIFYIDFKVPEDWSMKTQNGDCTSYVITNDTASVNLTIQPICGSLDNISKKWPADGKIIKEQAYASDDNATSYTVRYFDTDKSVYNYVGALAKPPLNTKTTQMDNYLTIKHSPYQPHTFVAAHITMKYSGDQSEKENTLQTIDQIIASIHLR